MSTRPYPDYPVERAALDALRDALLRDHPGDYVVLLGATLVAVVPTLEEALERGFAAARGPRFFVERLTHGPPRLWLTPRAAS